MRDLMDESDKIVVGERSRVASVGWGARLLDLQAPNGQWGGGTFFPHWVSTFYTLLELRELGLDPTSERARRAIGLVRENVTWGPEFDDAPYFEGEVEPCINGRVLALGAYFGEASDRLLDRLLHEQQADGGWNCEAPPSKRSSFHTTICVLEGLLEYEKAKGTTTAVRDARLRGQEYLLERSMFRSLSTGEVIDPDWRQFSFPTRWHYDVLWGLDYLRRAGVTPDPRVAEAIDLVERKRDSDGRWPLENPHAVRSTSTWKTAPANLAAGTHSAHCECWTGIEHETNPDATVQALANSAGTRIIAGSLAPRRLARPRRLACRSALPHL
jgi:hypothetical protein